ncbi:MAG TPA: CHAT domain-containing protein, partial [Anaerolineae bacterium]|nr:CHAT domain-containing protein [Anaerolineae bacterium]
ERSTRLLMEQFYRLVSAGMGFATALQQAQLYLRTLSRKEALTLLGGDACDAGWAEQPFADPFYWAPFILIDGGR